MPATLASISPEHRVYLNPIGLIFGETAAASIACGDALPLAGGPVAFDRVEVRWRRPGAAGERTVISLAELQNVASVGESEVAGRLSTGLARLSVPRRPFGGIALETPRLMGVLNVTPDSFSDGGRYADAVAAIDHGHRLCEAGADIVDIGGESTRPGADPISTAEELDRVIPVVEGLRETGVPISIDTRRAGVMRAAIAAGASIVNDTSALTYDTDSLGVVCELGVSVVLMHCQGDPKTMQTAPHYTDPICDIYDYLEDRVAACHSAGIDDGKIAVDPGIGFGKSVSHNLDILANVAMLHGLSTGILVGASRKSFIERLSPDTPSDQRLPGSLAVALSVLRGGVQIVRVHDVAESRQAINVWCAIEANQSA